MRFDKMVKHNGIIYKAGADVPVEQTVVIDVEDTPLEERTVKQLKALATAKGLEFKGNASKETLLQLLDEQVTIENDGQEEQEAEEEQDLLDLAA